MKEREEVETTIQLHRLVYRQGEAPGLLMVYLCVAYMWSELNKTTGVMRNKPGTGGLGLGLVGSEEPSFSHAYCLTFQTKSSREWM